MTAIASAAGGGGDGLLHWSDLSGDRGDGLEFVRDHVGDRDGDHVGDHREVSGSDNRRLEREEQSKKESLAAW